MVVAPCIFAMANREAYLFGKKVAKNFSMIFAGAKIVKSMRYKHSFWSGVFLIVWVGLAIAFGFYWIIYPIIVHPPPGFEGMGYIYTILGIVVLIAVYYYVRAVVWTVEIGQNNIVISYLSGRKLIIKNRDVTWLRIMDLARRPTEEDMKTLNNTERMALHLEKMLIRNKTTQSIPGVAIHYIGGSIGLGVYSYMNWREMLDELEKVTGEKTENRKEIDRL